MSNLFSDYSFTNGKPIRDLTKDPSRIKKPAVQHEENNLILHEVQAEPKVYHPNLSSVKDKINLKKHIAEPVPNWKCTDDLTYASVLEILAKRQQRFFLEANSKLDDEHQRIRTSMSIMF